MAFFFYRFSYWFKYNRSYSAETLVRVWRGKGGDIEFVFGISTKILRWILPNIEKKPESYFVTVSHSSLAVHKGGIVLVGWALNLCARSLISYTGKNGKLSLLEHKVALSSELRLQHSLPFFLPHPCSDTPLFLAARTSNPRSHQPSQRGERPAQGCLCYLGKMCLPLKLKEF